MKITLGQFNKMIREVAAKKIAEAAENPTMPVDAALYEAQPADDESMGDPKIKKLKEAVLRDLREVARYVK